LFQYLLFVVDVCHKIHRLEILWLVIRLQKRRAANMGRDGRADRSNAISEEVVPPRMLYSVVTEDLYATFVLLGERGADALAR
jgi:hypothetical protein